MMRYKNGPKKRARHSGELISETAFEFRFSFAGSLGVALMVDSEVDAIWLTIRQNH